MAAGPQPDPTGNPAVPVSSSGAAATEPTAAASNPMVAPRRRRRVRLWLYPHEVRRHPVGYTLGLLVLVAWIVGGVLFVPRVVDAAAYLMDAGGHGTFHPQAYAQECSRNGCWTVTKGTVVHNGHAAGAIWPTQVPLGQTFAVREPVWTWALGSELINNTGSAVGNFFVGLFFDAGAVLALFVIVRTGTAWRRHST